MEDSGEEDSEEGDSQHEGSEKLTSDDDDGAWESSSMPESEAEK